MNGTRVKIKKCRGIEREITFLLFLFTIFTLVAGTYLYEAYSKHYIMNHKEIFENVVLNMNSSYDYNYMIKEETNEYNLEFSGLVVNPNKIIGNFSDYNLEVYRIADNLFIKSSLQGDWEIVNEIDLEDLKGFVQSPSHVLEQVIMEWAKPDMVTRHSIGGKDYLLIIHSPESLEKDKFLLDYYPHLSSYSTTFLNCNVWITAEEPFLHKIEFIISLESPEGRTQNIRREMFVNLDAVEEEAPLKIREQI